MSTEEAIGDDTDDEMSSDRVDETDANTASDTEEQEGESERRLEELGFESTTLLASYDVFDEWSMEFVPEYYDRVSNARHGSRINDLKELDPYETRRSTSLSSQPVERFNRILTRSLRTVHWVSSVLIPSKKKCRRNEFGRHWNESPSTTSKY